MNGMEQQQDGNEAIEETVQKQGVAREGATEDAGTKPTFQLNQVRLCNGCWKKEAKLTCSACKQAKYCSKDCQKNHWRTHKPNCKPFDPTAPYTHTYTVHGKNYLKIFQFHNKQHHDRWEAAVTSIKKATYEAGQGVEQDWWQVRESVIQFSKEFGRAFVPPDIVDMVKHNEDGYGWPQAFPPAPVYDYLAWKKSGTWKEL